MINERKIIMASFNFNKATLGGRLTADIELKTTPNNVSVCQFTVATTRKGNREETDFINCVAWRNTAEFICKYFHKGSSICVTGAIQTRSWNDNNGNKRYATELVVDEAYFVDSKSENANGQQNKPQFENYSNDDDIPF